MIFLDSLEYMPDIRFIEHGPLSKKFLELGINNFREACKYVQKIEYGYNSDYENRMILFIENKGTCTTKHAVIAGLAAEIGIPIFKNVGVYKMTEKIVKNANLILQKYNLPYVPLVHCFLVYEKEGKKYQFDLTEGNNNGKQSTIQEFIHSEQVDPFISRKDEYKLYKKVVKEKVLPSIEMKGITERIILKAREEAIELLKKNMVETN